MASGRQGVEQVERPFEEQQDHPRGGLFAGKLRIPPVAQPHVLRPRLHELCEAGVRAGSVVVSAPAGSGKTQLVAAWARQRAASEDVAWLTLDEADRDPARFVKYVIAAIRTTASGRLVMDSLAKPSPVVEINEAFLVTVVDAMARLPRPVVLVLDDFQAVARSATELLLERMMRFPPEQVRPVVLSRTEPALGVARLRLQGLLRELAAGDLAFTPEETRSLFRAHGIELGDTQLAAVLSRTMGWATGVQAIAAPGHRGEEPAAQGVAFTVGESLANEFLMEQVFEGQPPEVQRFILRAGIVDRVCGDLADALTGLPGGGRTLADLHRAHVFLDPLDEMRSERCQWYRWHPMFASMLRTWLHAADPELERELHLRASRWLRAEGLVVEAVRHSVAAADVEEASSLLGETWLDLVVAGEAAVVRSLLSLFGDEQRAASAELAVIGAFDAAQAHDMESASRWAEKAARLAADLPRRRREPVQTMATVIRLHAASMTGTDNALRTSALRTLEELEDPVRPPTSADRRRRVLLLHHLGDLEASLWMYDAPLEHLTEAISQAAALDMPSIVLRSRVQLASIDFFAGRLVRAGRSARDVIGEAESHGWHGQHHLAAAHLVLGGVDMFHGDLDAALDRLAEARSLVHPVDQVTAFRIGFLTQLTLRTAGRVTAARTEVEALGRQLATWRAPDWARVLLAVAEADQLAAEGRPEQALGRVESVAGLATAAVANRHWRAFYGRLLLVCGEPAAARTVLAPLVAAEGKWPSQILALVTDAVAADCLGLRDAALDRLAAALRLAGEESVVHPFLTVGPRLRPLLDELRQRGCVYDDAALAILDRVGQARSTGLSTPIVEPLTPRELEVLQSMQGPASNQEIAARLFVSANTLRSHIKQIYRKLGVRNRLEAVARAREVGLL